MVRTDGSKAKLAHEWQLRIDKDFERLCPRLSDSEFRSLKESILREGCRDAIVVWNDVIIDGHNRHAICSENDIPFRVCKLDFNSRDEVRRWIVQNQLGRRNLTIIQASYLRGSYYRLVRQPNGGDKKNGKSEPTDKLLAQQFGVCPSTIRVDVQVSDAIDKLCPEAKAFVLCGEYSARKQNVIDLAQLTHDSQKLVCSKIARGDISDLRGAITKLRPVAVKGHHSVRCKGCRARLAPGVVRCLKCDLDDDKVSALLDQSEPKYPAKEHAEPDPDWQRRLNELRSAKTTGDEFLFHADWIRDAMASDFEYRDGLYQKAAALMADIRKRLDEVGPIHDKPMTPHQKWSRKRYAVGE